MDFDRSYKEWHHFLNTIFTYLNKFFLDVLNYENQFLQAEPFIIVDKNEVRPNLFKCSDINLTEEEKTNILNLQINYELSNKFVKQICYENEKIKISIVLDFGKIIALNQNEIFDYFRSYNLFEYIIDCILKNIESFVKTQMDGNELYKMVESDQLEGYIITSKLLEYTKKMHNNKYLYIDKLLIDLSNLNYENKSNTGMIIFTNENKLLVNFNNKFKAPDIFDSNYKKDLNYLRKLLQTTNGEIGLIFDGTNFIGIGRLKNYPNCATVQFKKGNTFILSEYTNSQKEDIMQVKNGRLMLPRMKVDKPIFESKLKDVFNTLNEEKINNLFEIVQAASEQSHGTTIVIMDKEKAKTEVSDERLGGVSTKIELKFLKEEGKEVDKDLIHSITSIDGAVLIDTDGNCHAIGVILDGVYNGGGEQGRGARYNSANTYANSNDDVLCIVFSEDGHINYLYQNKEMQ